jgi:hypothetical protein
MNTPTDDNPAFEQAIAAPATHFGGAQAVVSALFPADR